MNLFKSSLRLLIATGSLLGFLGGWVMLAQAKPAADSSPAEIAAPLAPAPQVPQLNNSNSSLQRLPVQPRFSTMPRLRTRGS